jgi:hypothetical protein
MRKYITKKAKDIQVGDVLLYIHQGEARGVRVDNIMKQSSIPLRPGMTTVGYICFLDKDRNAIGMYSNFEYEVNLFVTLKSLLETL